MILPSPPGRGAGGEGFASDNPVFPHPSPLPKGEGEKARHSAGFFVHTGCSVSLAGTTLGTGSPSRSCMLRRTWAISSGNRSTS